MAHKENFMRSAESHTKVYTDRKVSAVKFERDYYSYKTDLFSFSVRGCMSFEYPYKRVLIKGILYETRYKHKRPYNIELSEMWQKLEGQTPKEDAELQTN
jgi:type IV secretory pathway VirD2 relaxase